MEAFTPMINRLGREADYLPPSTAEAKNRWSQSYFHTDDLTAYIQISLPYHRLYWHVHQFLTDPQNILWLAYLVTV